MKLELQCIMLTYYVYHKVLVIISQNEIFSVINSQSIMIGIIESDTIDG